MPILFDPTGGGANINLRKIMGPIGWPTGAYSINEKGQIVGETQVGDGATTTPFSLTLTAVLL